MSQKSHICKFWKIFKGHLGCTVNLKSGGLYQLKMSELKVVGHTLQRCHLVIGAALHKHFSSTKESQPAQLTQLYYIRYTFCSNRIYCAGGSC